jgi:hypothetical protein
MNEVRVYVNYPNGELERVHQEQLRLLRGDAAETDGRVDLADWAIHYDE